MHSEHYHVSKEAADAINEARASGGRVVAVGTTSVRTLETVARPDGTIAPRARGGQAYSYIPDTPFAQSTPWLRTFIFLSRLW